MPEANLCNTLARTLITSLALTTDLVYSDAGGGPKLDTERPVCADLWSAITEYASKATLEEQFQIIDGAPHFVRNTQGPLNPPYLNPRLAVRHLVEMCIFSKVELILGEELRASL